MRRQVNFLEMGQRLKLVRKSLNLQQKEMAVELGIPASYLSEIESGKGNPGPEFFNKLACEYNISMDYLVLGIGEMFIQKGVRIKRQEFDFSGEIDSLEKLIWLMETSTFFYSAVMADANRILLADESLVKRSINKKTGRNSLNGKVEEKDSTSDERSDHTENKSKQERIKK